MDIIPILKEHYRYSDWYFYDEQYEQHLRKLWTMPLTQEIVTYLCAQIDNPKNKRDCELRFIHLKPFLLNQTTPIFDLKQYFYIHLKKSRRLWLELFYIMAFAIYANEEEIIPIMHQFNSSLESQHDYVDYEQILSEVGLPLLIRKYNYRCFSESLDKARTEYLKINPLLRGFFTRNKCFDIVELVSLEEYKQRMLEYARQNGFEGHYKLVQL
jgi:hypothetical protein